MNSIAASCMNLCMGINMRMGILLLYRNIVLFFPFVCLTRECVISASMKLLLFALARTLWMDVNVDFFSCVFFSFNKTDVRMHVCVRISGNYNAIGFSNAKSIIFSLPLPKC